MKKPNFIIILEDSEIMLAEEISDEDIAACEDGVIDIISIRGPVPVQYYSGGWHGIDHWEGC